MNNLGKFEACKNEKLGQYLHGISLDGCCDDEIGDVQDFGWYALITSVPGIGKFKSYIIQEDNNGFFTYSTHNKQEAIDTFNELVKQYNDEYENSEN